MTVTKPHLLAVMFTQTVPSTACHWLSHRLIIPFDNCPRGVWVSHCCQVHRPTYCWLILTVQSTMTFIQLIIALPVSVHIISTFITLATDTVCLTLDNECYFWQHSLFCLGPWLVRWRHSGDSKCPLCVVTQLNQTLLLIEMQGIKQVNKWEMCWYLCFY